jgi:hypothetical protein
MKTKCKVSGQNWKFDGSTITVSLPMALYGTCSVKSFLSYCSSFRRREPLEATRGGAGLRRAPCGALRPCIRWVRVEPKP